LHWRSFLDSEIIRYADLADRGDITLKIAKVVKGKVKGKSGKDSGSKALIYFEGAERPLAAGTTILSAIGRLYSNDVRKWPGQSITLYADHDVVFGGERVGGVRVRPVVPKAEEPKAAKEGAA
jgi:hypothetical protein